jgi:hypothetical protein
MCAMGSEPDREAQRRIRRWILEQRYESLRAGMRREGEHAGPSQSGALREPGE